MELSFKKMMNSCTWYTWKTHCTRSQMLPSGKKFPCKLKLQAESCWTEILDWGCIDGEGVRADAWLVRVDRLKGSLELHFHFLRWDRRSYGTHETQTLKDAAPFMKVKPSHAFPRKRTHYPKASRRTLNWLKLQHQDQIAPVLWQKRQCITPLPHVCWKGWKRYSFRMSWMASNYLTYSNDEYKSSEIHVWHVYQKGIHMIHVTYLYSSMLH